LLIQSGLLGQEAKFPDDGLSVDIQNSGGAAKGNSGTEQAKQGFIDAPFFLSVARVK